jgi:hypothetical protein
MRIFFFGSSRKARLLLPILLWASGAGGQDAPVNDACASATISTFSYSEATNTAEATTDPDDPVPSCSKGGRAKSVWYQFTTPGPGTIVADTLGSEYDTILSVYTGECGDVDALANACNDDDPRDGDQSRVSFLAEGETTYFFFVSAFADNGGDLIFHLEYRPAVVCIGDCNGDGVLMSSECDTCQSILDGQPLALCQPCDGNSNGGVETSEVNLCRLGIRGCIACAGDCDGSGRVTASDLVTAVALIAHCPCEGMFGGTATGCPALPTLPTECRAADRDRDACVVPEELDPLLSNIFRCGPP